MAISKERLWKLINDGSCIYTIEYGKVELHDLLKEDVYFDDEEDYLDIKDGFGFLDRFGLQEIFETKEDAKWHKEFGCIERTEKLELPTWEYVSKDFIPLKVASGQYPVIEFVGESSSFYNIDIIVRENKTTDILLCDEWKTCLKLPLTKENYIKACRKAKELFLGEQL